MGEYETLGVRVIFRWLRVMIRVYSGVFRVCLECMRFMNLDLQLLHTNHIAIKNTK